MEILSKGKEKITLQFGKPIAMFSVFFKGKLYHFRKPETSETFSEISFNTDGAGSYETFENPIKILKSKIDYVDLTNFILPPPEVNFKKPTYFVKNPYLFTTPARIFTDSGKIEVGAKFDLLPLQIQKFIVLHEVGHLYYNDESNCDLFALYHFLKQGYNESNAFYALSKVLSRSPENLERIEKLYKSIQATK